MQQESAGAGIFVEDEGEREEVSLPLGKYATVFQAEVYAILQCARLEKVEGGGRRGVCICSDSQAAIRALSSPKISSALVLESRKALEELAERKPVKLLWAPGHVGIQGNENADRLAREGSSTAFVGPEPALGISPRVVRTALRDWAYQGLRAYWDAYPHARQSKEFIPGPDQRLGKLLLNFFAEGTPGRWWESLLDIVPYKDTCISCGL